MQLAAAGVVDVTGAPVDSVTITVERDSATLTHTTTATRLTMPRIESTLARDYQCFSRLPEEERRLSMENWRDYERSVEDGSYHRTTLRALKDHRRKYGKTRINSGIVVRARIHTRLCVADHCLATYDVAVPGEENAGVAGAAWSQSLRAISQNRAPPVWHVHRNDSAHIYTPRHILPRLARGAYTDTCTPRACQLC